MRCDNCGTEWSIAIQGNSIQKYCPVCGKPVIQVNTPQLSSLEETLFLIARDYGLAQLQDGVRAMAYFSDLAPHLRKEKVMLQHLIQCNGNTLLIAALQKSPAEQQVCINQLVSRLMDDLFVSESAANRICSSFWNAITIASTPKANALTPEEMYRQSNELEKSDIRAAFDLLTKASEAGYVDAQTKLAKWYESGEYTPLEREHYIKLVATALQYFHKDTVIARLTGDGVADDLLAPDWSRKKTTVINDIDKYLFNHDMWQGKEFHND